MSRPIAVLVPCYNVGESCVAVICGAAQHADLCVAVDDGSTDDTASHMQNLRLQNLMVIRHEHNRGKGAAILTGFRSILSARPETTAIVTLDGDGQHDPGLIPEFAQKQEQTGADLVYGNRMLDQQTMPWHRRQLNALSNRLISNICKQRIFDSQCGFRLYSKGLIEALANELKSNRYELETEVLIKATQKGMRIETVPVSTIYTRQIMKLSHHSLADVLRIARLLTRYLF